MTRTHRSQFSHPRVLISAHLVMTAELRAHRGRGPTFTVGEARSMLCCRVLANVCQIGAEGRNCRASLAMARDRS